MTLLCTASYDMEKLIIPSTRSLCGKNDDRVDVEMKCCASRTTCSAAGSICYLFVVAACCAAESTLFTMICEIVHRPHKEVSSSIVARPNITYNTSD